MPLTSALSRRTLLESGYIDAEMEISPSGGSVLQAPIYVKQPMSYVKQPMSYVKQSMRCVK
jgi:hypothetical protein